MRYGNDGKGKLILSGIAVIGILGYGGYVLVGSTVGKINSNRDKLDTEKAFNMAIEETRNTVSLVNIKNYTDYTGDTVEFETYDGLRVLTSVVNTSLIKENRYQDAYNYAKLLADGQEDRIISYDELQGNEVDLSNLGWNKRLNNFNYNFDKAIEMEDDGSVIIYDVQSWKDWEDDDKVQIITKDGRVLLSHFKKLRLVDTTNAEKGAFENYVLSLVGEPEKIDEYNNTGRNNVEKPKILAKKNELSNV